MANKLIHWNCCGLKANFNELLLLLTGLCPSIICLQETFLKPSDNLDIRGYTMYNHIHQAGDKDSGGSSIILNNCIPQSQIQLNTYLQAVAVKVEECNEPSCEALIFPYGVVLFNIFSTICI